MPELTYDPTPADQPEFTEAEQEALKVGEERMEQEQQLLAGKFTDAEELEKAYIELQKKMGQGDAEPEAEPEPEPEEVDPIVDLIRQARENDDFDINSFKDMDPTEVAKTFLESTSEPEDLSQEDINDIRNSVGGEQNYAQLMTWATEQFPQEAVDGFDALVDSGNKYAIQLAVNGLVAMYNNQNGVEPELLTGRGGGNDSNVFRSQAEVIQAMNDPRYDNDPAYRQDLYSKLERSNLDTY